MEAGRRTAVLGVSLLHVAEALCQKFDGDVFVVLYEMLLCGRACVVDEGVGVCREACYACYHVPVSR